MYIVMQVEEKGDPSIYMVIYEGCVCVLSALVTDWGHLQVEGDARVIRRREYGVHMPKEIDIDDLVEQLGR